MTQIGAHEIFEGQPVGPLHAIDDDQTLCEDYTADELTIVTEMTWADTTGRRCPACEVLASALGIT